MNRLCGLVLYVPTSGRTFGDGGGNHRLIELALQQARWMYGNLSCVGGAPPQRRVRRRQAVIAVVVAGKHSMELFKDNDGNDAAAGGVKKSLGAYNVIILAAPLQQNSWSRVPRATAPCCTTCHCEG